LHRSPPVKDWTYDGFISYCTAADREFAPKIQDGLEKLAKPWGARTALDIFQDIDDLAATHDLEQAFRVLFSESQTLIFLASPGAAASEWCNDEVAHWIRNRPPEHLIVVLTDGTLTFDKNADHPIIFDRSSAAPPAFAELTAVPLYIDMTEERRRTDPFDHRTDSNFRAKLTKVAAAVHSNKTGEEVRPRDIDSRDLEEHRKTRRLRNAAVIALAAISLVALGAAVVAELQRRDADDGRQVALSKQLASQSVEASSRQLALGSLLGIEAYRIRQTPEALGSMITAASRSADVRKALHGHERPVRAVAYNEDGTLIASAGSDGSIILRDGDTYDTIGPPVRPAAAGGPVEATIRDVAFSPTAPVLAAATTDGRVQRWDLSDPTAAVELTPFRSTLLDDRTIASIAFSSPGMLVAAGGQDADDGLCRSETTPVVLIDLDSAVEQWLGDASECVTGVAIDPNGQRVATAQEDGTITIWETASPGVGRVISAAHGQDAGGTPFGVQSVAFSPDGALLASAGRDGTARTWDVSAPNDPRELVVYTGHDNIVRTVAFGPDGTMVASGDRDGQVDLWDPITGFEIRPLSARHAGEVRRVAFHPSGSHFVSASADETVVVWNVATADRRTLSIPVHDGLVRAVAYDDRRDTIISSRAIVGQTGDPTANGLVWTSVPIDGSAEVVVPVATASVAVDPTSRTVATGDAKGGLTLWDSDTRTPRLVQPADLGCGDPSVQPGALLSLAFHPTSSWLALGFRDGTLVLWDPSGQSETRCDRMNGPVWDVAFSPDGNQLAASAGRSTVVLWDLESDERTRPVAATEDVRSLAFDPTGATLAVGGSEGDIVFLDVESTTGTGQPVRGHEGMILDLAYDPSGTVLASGGEDGLLRLWNTSTRTELTDPLSTSSARVYSIAWILDGGGLVTGGDRGALVWDLRANTLRRSLCEVANRNLEQFEWESYVGAERARRPSCDELALPPGPN
jgi:WD40 repeat protein